MSRSSFISRSVACTDPAIAPWITDTDHRHGSQTRITDTDHRHGSQTRITDTDHRHGSQTRITDTDHRHGSQTRITDTDHRHGSQTRITDTDHRHGSQTRITDTDHRHGSVACTDPAIAPWITASTRIIDDGSNIVMCYINSYIDMCRLFLKHAVSRTPPWNVAIVADPPRSRPTRL